jgi:beta-galactosidase
MSAQSKPAMNCVKRISPSLPSFGERNCVANAGALLHISPQRMPAFNRIPLALVLLLIHAFTSSARETLNFDSDWHFFKGDAAGAEDSGFDDSHWRKLDVPHDWSIEGPFSKTNKTGGAGAFLPGGVAWYRKEFSLPEKFLGKRIFIEFDGVMQNSDVWINGFHLGHRPNGYVSFGYELTDTVLNYGSDGVAVNVLAVRADTSAQPASRWYSGAGIYRHVRLVITGPVHFAENGVFISTPQADEKQARVHIESAVVAQGANEKNLPREVTVHTAIISPDGKNLGAVESNVVLSNGAAGELKQEFGFQNPELWSLDDPKLYRAVSTILSGDKILDEVTNTFGVRHFEFRADTGFWLNGKNFKIKGVCLHHDGSAFGAAVPLGVWEHRLAQLKKLGVNAIRTAHNPPAPEFLDLCDRMGFLVMDEFFDCWTVGKNPFDYHLFFNDWSKIDARDTVRRDRNHPGIILYSVGNEIHDTPNADLAKKILSGLVAVCHENDPTRPVTQALFRPNASHDYDNGLADMLDVVGTNYRDNELLAAQRAHPGWKIIGTEQRHDRQTWLWMRDNPSHSGQFLWTGVDYLGESRFWPLAGHASGLLDRTGEIKPMAFPRESWWSEKPVVRMARRVAKDDAMPTDPGYGGPELHTEVQFADWTPRDLNPHDENVEVYSNCEDVELFLNGKSLGAKKINADASPRIWVVKFEPGALKAVGKNGGQVADTFELRTGGKPEKIILSATPQNLAPGWDNVSFVNATVVDANGIAIPNASDLISFKISGPGKIAAVDSADNSSHEPFQATERRAFHGRCQAIVKATAARGSIVVTATAPGLSDGKITLTPGGE